MAKSAPTERTVDRRARRRQATREKLVAAARELVAEQGLDSVTVTDISERADIGAGTFYNYFTSRDAVIEAVIEAEISTLGRRLDAMSRDLDDAAEIVAASLRHLMGTAISDPVWGRFIVRLGLAHPQLMSTLGPRATRDMQIGIDSGRFDIPNLPMAADIVFGSLLSAIHANQTSPHAGSDPTVELAVYGLRMLGVDPSDADEISRRPLPPLPSYEEALDVPQRPDYDLADFGMK